MAKAGAKEIRIGLIGYKFMGRAHSSAYRQVSAFFNPPLKPRLKVVCGRDEKAVQEFATRFGWEHYTTDWREVVADPEIDLVDIAAPNDLHAPIALAAAEAGKAIFCEKPLARDLAEALEMLRAVERAGVPHMVCFNYRFLPAIRLAKRLIDEGLIGKIRQFRALYLQDWLKDPGFPLLWRMQKERAGSGALGDIAVHAVDLTRCLVGELVEIVGMTETFVKERPLPEGTGMGKVTVDDAAAFLGRFAGGAIGVFEATRLALGRRNSIHIELNGETGSLFWNSEELNSLWFYSEEDPGHARGFRRIIATDPDHPYVRAWWPPGHLLGYEHSFVHAVLELLEGLAARRAPSPSFRDGAQAQTVLDSVLRSAAERQWVAVPQLNSEGA